MPEHLGQSVCRICGEPLLPEEIAEERQTHCICAMEALPVGRSEATDREHLTMLRTPDDCACVLCELLRERGLFPPAGSPEARLPHRISDNEARLLLAAVAPLRGQSD